MRTSIAMSDFLVGPNRGVQHGLSISNTTRGGFRPTRDFDASIVSLFGGHTPATPLSSSATSRMPCGPCINAGPRGPSSRLMSIPLCPHTFYALRQTTSCEIPQWMAPSESYRRRNRFFPLTITPPPPHVSMLTFTPIVFALPPSSRQR